MTPFYRKALALFTRTQEAQIAKGLAKYPNTFNPHDWTPEELLNHALEETVDLTHYLVGLKELLDAKDEEIRILTNNLAMARKDNKYLAEDYEKLKMNENGNLTQEQMQTIYDNYKNIPAKSYNLKNLQRKSPFEEQYDMNFNPHFDQDDQ